MQTTRVTESTMVDSCQPATDWSGRISTSVSSDWSGVRTVGEADEGGPTPYTPTRPRTARREPVVEWPAWTTKRWPRTPPG
jgi:hypothetical protein